MPENVETSPPKIEKISIEELENAQSNPHRELTNEDFNPSGEIKTVEGDLALVVQSAVNAKAFISNKQ